MTDFQKARDEEWVRIMKEEEIGSEAFISPGYHAYEDGIVKLVDFGRKWTLESYQVAGLVEALEVISAQATPHKFLDNTLVPERHNFMAETARLALAAFEKARAE